MEILDKLEGPSNQTIKNQGNILYHCLRVMFSMMQRHLAGPQCKLAAPQSTHLLKSLGLKVRSQVSLSQHSILCPHFTAFIGLSGAFQSLGLDS